MELTLIVLGCLVAMTTARPETILSVISEDQQHDQDVDQDHTVTGTYRWMSPEQVEYFVSYVADKDGFRILDSNAVPVSAAGVRADGNQGSFLHSHEVEFDTRTETTLVDGVKQLNVFLS